jgi:hypothetical protein
MNVIQILESQILVLKGEGLSNGDRECGCMCGDLAPCGDISPECEVAVNDPFEAENQNCDFWMVALPSKPQA